MTDQYSGTSLDKSKGDDEFEAVENLIKETLKESQILSKKEEKTTAKAEETRSKIQETNKDQATQQPSHPITKSQEEKKEEFSGTKISPAEQTASSYDATFKEYQVGDIVKGKVLKIDQSGVLVDVKYKADGIILPEEIAPGDHLKVGDIIDVMIENLESKEGNIVLSKQRADQEVVWKKAYDSYKHKSVLNGKVIQVLKGGLVVDCAGLRGFVPASQVKREGSEAMESLKDKVLPLKVIEVNRRQGKIVLSHKLAAGEKNREDSSKIFDELEVGQVRKGTVSSLKTFGAFVNLGGVEGLIHLSELSWKRVKHPSEMLKVGQELEVFVLGVDKINKKVALGLKELQADPWAEATDHFKVGQVVKAKILRFAKFGAFAELDHNLEGLIHISEMSKERILQPDEAAKIGDVVDVKILRILPEEQRIGLSIKQVIIDKEKAEAKAVMASNPIDETPKVTIGDMIAKKEQDRMEQEEMEDEVEEEAPEEIETETDNKDDNVSS